MEDAGIEIRDSSIAVLAVEGARFVFFDVEPASVSRGVVDVQLLSQAPG
jgi:hypothetical protein